MNGDKKMRRLLPALAIAATLAAAAAPAGSAEALVASDAGQRVAVQLTVYNHDLALVRDVRRVTLPKGEFGFEFRDVPARINPVTLLVAAGGNAGLAILEQNYEFDLMSPDRILAKYVGREIAWIQEDGTRITGRLLGTQNGPVYEVGGEIVFEVPGRVALPALPENLRARPTLVWQASAERGGATEVEASYLTAGISWSADYVLELDPAGRLGDLQAWVSVDNRCGAAFADAALLLVAGDINQVRPPRAAMVEMADYALAAKAGNFEEESLFDYHLYTLQRPTTVKDNQIKQISLFEAQGLKVERRYRLQGAPRHFRALGMLREKPGVAVHYRFENREENNLGLPLPAGIVRVYGQAASGSRQLLGEDRIDHTPRNEAVELEVGQAFDLVAERVRTDSRRLADNVFQHAFEITLRNHKTEDVVVEVLESVGGDWEVLDANLAHEKRDAGTLAFQVPVRADGEAKLTYTIQVTF